LKLSINEELRTTYFQVSEGDAHKPERWQTDEPFRQQDTLVGIG
jgi:hypothetical protein